MDIASLKPKIQHVLTQPGVDLSTISAKRVRKQLAVLGVDPQLLRDQKEQVDDLIAQIFQSVSQGEPSAAHADDPSPSHSPQKRKRSQSADVNFAEPPSSQPYPLEHKVATSKAPKVLSSDMELARQLSMEINARSTRGSSNGAQTTKTKSKSKSSSANKKSAKVKSKAVVDSEGEDDDTRPKKKAKGGFAKEFILSEPLSSLVGVSMLSRPHAVKKIWEYIKLNNLQDPKDKRDILCDSHLKAVFKTDKVNMFKMNKILGEHLIEPGEDLTS